MRKIDAVGRSEKNESELRQNMGRRSTVTVLLYYCTTVKNAQKMRQKWKEDGCGRAVRKTNQSFVKNGKGGKLERHFPGPLLTSSTLGDN